MDNQNVDPFARRPWSAGAGSLSSLTPEQMATVVGYVNYHTSPKGYIYAGNLIRDLKEAYAKGGK